MRHRPSYYFIISAAAALSACRTTQPGREPAPETTPAPSPATPATPPRTDSSAATWEFRYRPGRYRYEIRQTATIELTEGDSAQRTSPIETATRYTLTIVPKGEQLQIAGTVDSFSIKRGRVPPSPDSTITGQSGFVATITSAGTLVAFQGPPGDSCDAKATVAQAAQELFPELPERLTVGQRWHDTTTALRCHGGVAISSSTASAYRVLGAETSRKRAIIRIERGYVTRLAGKASYRRQPFEVAGEDRGTMTLHVDPARGYILGWTERSTATFQISAGSSRNTFRQELNRTATALP